MTLQDSLIAIITLTGTMASLSITAYAIIISMYSIFQRESEDPRVTYKKEKSMSEVKKNLHFLRITIYAFLASIFIALPGLFSFNISGLSLDYLCFMCSVFVFCLGLIVLILAVREMGIERFEH
jgi:hypothetical protein